MLAGSHDTEMTMDGIVTKLSPLNARDTMDRLEAAIRAKGLAVFARIDHAAGAAQAGLALRPTELLVFGSALSGTPLMQAKQTIGIDLPLKALVWMDETGKVWLSYTDPHWIVSRHGEGASMNERASAMTSTLETLARIATEPA